MKYRFSLAILATKELIGLMFGLGRLFRREIRKAVKSAISTPPKKPTTTTIKTQSVVKQVQVQTRTATQTTTQTTTQVSQSQIIRGKCHVIDGDTIAIGKQKIRLAGIDAPSCTIHMASKQSMHLLNFAKATTSTLI